MNPENEVTAFESELEQESVQERIDSREVYEDDGADEECEYDPGELKENQDFAQDDGPYYDDYDRSDYFGEDF